MATKLRQESSRRNTPPPKLSSKDLEEQVQAFLAKGGQIEYVDHGVSGHQNLPGRKHIVLNSKAKESEAEVDAPETADS